MLTPFTRIFSLDDGEVLGCTPAEDSVFEMTISFHFLLRLRKPKSSLIDDSTLGGGSVGVQAERAMWSNVGEGRCGGAWR
ncbi:hypothetical protein KIMH_13560 [Bombiscardovia apis]|uniref:Uncharacterized protein n=1 Tax=Bombiscardovia apis TaxID=2932182 RepID=A0ABN6SGV9_9BIFI|nr:hypothetical protein KIMH_13560 [Bombiscardovia apis]